MDIIGDSGLAAVNAQKAKILDGIRAQSEAQSLYNRGLARGSASLEAAHNNGVKTAIAAMAKFVPGQYIDAAIMDVANKIRGKFVDPSTVHVQQVEGNVMTPSQDSPYYDVQVADQINQNSKGY